MKRNIKAGRRPVYEENLKIAAAREYLTGNLSYAEVAAKYGIAGGADAVRWFVKWYDKNYRLGLSKGSGSPPGDGGGLISPKQQQELERQLSDANLKIAALEMMIRIAEKDLGVDIRKKPGAKQ